MPERRTIKGSGDRLGRRAEVRSYNPDSHTVSALEEYNVAYIVAQRIGARLELSRDKKGGVGVPLFRWGEDIVFNPQTGILRDAEKEPISVMGGRMIIENLSVKFWALSEAGKI